MEFKRFTSDHGSGIVFHNASDIGNSLFCWKVSDKYPNFAWETGGTPSEALDYAKELGFDRFYYNSKECKYPNYKESDSIIHPNGDDGIIFEYPSGNTKRYLYAWKGEIDKSVYVDSLCPWFSDAHVQPSSDRFFANSLGYKWFWYSPSILLKSISKSPKYTEYSHLKIKIEGDHEEYEKALRYLKSLGGKWRISGENVDVENVYWLFLNYLRNEVGTISYTRDKDSSKISDMQEISVKETTRYIVTPVEKKTIVIDDKVYCLDDIKDAITRCNINSN